MLDAHRLFSHIMLASFLLGLAQASPLSNLPGTPPFLPNNAAAPVPPKTVLLSDNPANPEALSLQNAVLLSLHKNPNLIMSINNRKVERYDLLVAEDAFHPQFSIAGSANYSQYNDNQGTSSITRQANIGPEMNWLLPLGTQISTQWGYTPSNQTSSTPSTTGGNTWSVTITQPLLQNFGIATNEVNLNNAKDQQTIDTLQLKQTVMETIINTISDYYALVEAEQSYAIAKQTLKSKEKTLWVRNAEYHAGRIPGLDVTQAKLDITTQQQAVEQAKVAVSAAKTQLLTVDLGLPADTHFHIIPTLSVQKLPTPSLTTSLPIALKKNLSLQIALLQYQQEQRNLLTSENQNRWTLNLVASRSRTLQTLEQTESNVITNSNTLTNNSSIGLNLSIPLDRTTIDQAELSAATAMDNAQITLESTKQTLASNLASAIQSLENLWVALQVSRQNLTLTAVNTKAAEIKFSYGKLDAYTLSEQQAALVTAKLNVINNEIAYLKQVLTYQQLMGTLLDAWHIHFNDPTT